MSGPRQWLAWLVLVASIAAVGVAGFSGYEARGYARCQSRVNDQLVRSIRARGAAVDERDSAMDALVDAILSAQTREESRAAIERYRQAVEQVRADRADNPLPDPPSQTC